MRSKLRSHKKRKSLSRSRSRKSGRTGVKRRYRKSVRSLRGGAWGESSTLIYLAELEKQGGYLYDELRRGQSKRADDLSLGWDTYDKTIYMHFQQVCDKIKEVCRKIPSSDACKVDLREITYDGDKNEVTQGTRADHQGANEKYLSSCRYPANFYDSLRKMNPNEAKEFKEWVKGLNLEKKLRDKRTGKLMF